MPVPCRILVLFAFCTLILSGCSGDTNPFDPDNCIPDRIIDARLAYIDSSGDACLTWTSPDYCRKSDTVERYEIRYSFDGPFDWETAYSVIDPPAALPPGEIQTYLLHYPDRGHALFMAVASVGSSGRPSRPGNTAVLAVPGFRIDGLCRNVYTDEPLAGMVVTLQLADTVNTVTTDANGRFSFVDLAAQTGTLEIRSGTTVPSWFGLLWEFTVDRDISREFPMIPFQMSEVLPTVSLLSLFKEAVYYTDPTQSHQLAKWARRPVAIFIPAYVNSANVDYGALARAAVRRWMDRTGYELFRFVEEPPDTGITFHYRSRAEMGALNGVTRHTFGDDGLPLRDDVEIANDLPDSSFVYRVLLHETGHTLQFKHLSSPRFIMYYGQPLPNDISDDEVRLVRLLESLPNRTDISVYREVEE